MSKIFNIAQKLLPRISKTELIALRSGTVSVDREIISGKVNINNFLQLENKKTSYLDNELIDMCSKLQHEKVFNGKVNQKVLTNLSKNKAFSYIIKKQ